MGQFFPDKHKGLHKKFNVTRADGSSEPGGKHEDCRYFVLDIDHDPFAIPALRAYAHACAESHPDLAADLFELVGQGTDEPTYGNERL